MAAPKRQVVGIPWFDSKDYGEVLAVMEDANTLPATYAAWLAATTSYEAHVVQNGQHPVRVAIDPHGFLAWCIYHGLRADQIARQRFAAMEAGAGNGALGRRKLKD